MTSLRNTKLGVQSKVIAILVLNLAIITVAVQGQTNCPGGQLTSAIRSDIIYYQNLRRSLVAKGKWGLGPRGRNIYALSYDCSLEASAQQVASSCGSAMGSSPTALGAIGENTYSHARGTARNAFFRKAASIWWSQAAVNRILQHHLNYSSAARSSGIGNYAQVAWGSTTLVGCGFAKCSNADSRYVCHYQVRRTVNHLVYETGSGCTLDADCTTFPGSTCDRSKQLCEKPAGVGPLPPGMVTPTTMSPMATTTTSSLDCGGPSVMTIGTRNSIVNQHNALRTLIARTQPIDGLFKQGSNAMFKMMYDCALERRAQTEADSDVRCNTDDVPLTPVRGQNVYVETTTFSGLGTLLQSAITNWRSEVSLFSQQFTIGQGANILSNIGRFAQMAYWRTTAVGCGVGRCLLNRTVFVCRYRVARPDANARVYPVSTSPGCATAACQRGNRNAICNATSGFCEL